jgi:beta-glucosidase
MEINNRLTSELRDLFPDDFIWGSSVSAHQVEGGNINQWTIWEQEHAAEFSKSAEERWSSLPIWGAIKNDAAKPESYISGDAVNHRKLFKQDFIINKQLGLNTLRFSIEWSRIEPEEGVFDIEAIKFYRSYIEELLKLGQTPIVTLWHWTLPTWFADKGGFSKRANLEYWQRFVEKITDELDWSKTTYVLTVNEPNTYMGMSYAIGEFPPGEKKYLRSLYVYYNLALAHRIAYRVLKSRHKHLKIAPALQINNVVPARKNNVIDRTMVVAEQYFYWWFMARARNYDFVGMNHYFTDVRKGLSLLGHQPQPHNDMGFYMDPAGIELAIKKSYKKLKKPILITENGVADREDQYRLWWLTETIHALANARRSGVDVIGYVHWSLLDNFEWQFGWMQKFGLVSVDRTTMKRTVKQSAKSWANWLNQK